jgi:hypothetical protein
MAGTPDRLVGCLPFGFADPPTNTCVQRCPLAVLNSVRFYRPNLFDQWPYNDLPLPTLSPLRSFVNYFRAAHCPRLLSNNIPVCVPLPEPPHLPPYISHTKGQRHCVFYMVSTFLSQRKTNIIRTIQHNFLHAGSVHHAERAATVPSAFGLAPSMPDMVLLASIYE